MDTVKGGIITIPFTSPTLNGTQSVEFTWTPYKYRKICTNDTKKSLYESLKEWWER